MSIFEISVTVHPSKKVMAVCKQCKYIVHSYEWIFYKDLQEKKKQYAKYKVCPFCNKTKESKND